MKRLIIVSTFLCVITQAVWAQSFTPRKYYGARLEPTSKVFHGAGQSNWSTSVSEYRQALQGRYDPSVVNDYVGFEGTQAGMDGFVSKVKTWLSQFPSFAALQLGVTMGSAAYEGGPFVDRTQAIADGQYDAKIAYLFSKLAELNVPIYFRFGYECNGSWNGYSPASYKAAFIRVTNALRSSALKNSAATVWNIAAAGASDYTQWYPGDAYVDWWSIDLYDPGEITSSIAANYLRDANAHQRPVMIGESSGVPGVDKGWNTWFKPYFDLIHNNPGIKMFNYVNWDWRNSKNPAWGDCRIGQSATVTASYALEMSLPLYIHASSQQAFWDNVTPPAAFFPQFAVGGGWSTRFSFTNTGTTAASGRLSLKDDTGAPVQVSGIQLRSAGNLNSIGSSFDLAIPAAGTVYFIINSVNPGDPMAAGWARFDGDTVAGSAVYEYAPSGNPAGMAGVPPSEPLLTATIPIDDDAASDRAVGFAVANPGNTGITVKLTIVAEDGTVVDNSMTIPLGPGEHRAEYLWQKNPAAYRTFRGSMVLTSDSEPFIAMALTVRGSIFGSIPIIPKK